MGGGGGGGGGGLVGSGVRVDVNEELKSLVNFTKKIGGGGREGGQVGVGLVGGRVDVNAMLGVGGDDGNGPYGGCEPRIEGIVQCTKRYCTILRKLKKCWGRGNI